MSTDNHTTPIDTTPIDKTAAANFASRGLRFDLLDGTDLTKFEPWLDAVSRGFYNSRTDEEFIPARSEAFSPRRLSGVWDDGSSDAATPIATASSWIAELTVPGSTSIPSWAISTITVAPTHRRRGVARDLLEAELRTAAALQVPVAILTASEATIYSRFGFSPAAMQADWTFDTTRAKWIGPTPAGRVQLVPSETVRDNGGHDLVERVRLATPGQIQFDGILWRRIFGIKGQVEPKLFRVVRYDDAAGEPQGFAIYKSDEKDHRASIEVTYFVAATDDAYAALWRYLFEMDLVPEVKAKLRPIDEPVQWQISDARAARKSNEGDHLWLRILDVKTTLEARHYSAPGVFVLDIADDLGFAEGTFLLSISETGKASVKRLDDAEGLAENHHLAMSVVDLAAIYLGGVPSSTLVHAGRITERTPGAALAADAAFRSAVTPWLSIWF